MHRRLGMRWRMPGSGGEAGSPAKQKASELGDQKVLACAACPLEVYAGRHVMVFGRSAVKDCMRKDSTDDDSLCVLIADHQLATDLEQQRKCCHMQGPSTLCSRCTCAYESKNGRIVSS